ncbi:NAD(P)/FAD-dependent oxidoreductase [Intrasporangium sp.]|uniref:NAD(P)/FAD-dependent oxidoreductase n=1 Tax=Intrasporangium sp. TaxID=1925024 RepID=UPI002939E216|nr:FAD-dependent oxidoreductase [Intrasporangium sp.]MDV3220847.1 FAD-dependent oxidoreductase [Intrasporangium sp.]
MAAPEKVVIVGGGIGGVSAAAGLRAGGFPGELVLVDDSEIPLDRPPLSKEYLAGTRSRPEIALEQPEWYDDHDVRLLARTRVAALRPGEGVVETDDGARLRADRVILATGGRAARPPIPGADGERVHVLRTVDDADRLRAAAASETRFLVVGAGLIGAEVASTLTGLGVDVTLVDVAARPLAGAVGEPVAQWLHDVHRARSVTVHQCGVERLESGGDGIRAHLGDGQGRVDVDQVVLSVGMVPEASLAKAAGLTTGRGVVVDQDQITSNPAVLAIGDATELRVDGVAVPRGEHWEAARLDGERAAATILGAPRPAATAPWFWTDRHGLHVEVVGEMAAGRMVVRGTLGSPPFSVFAIRDGVVVGAVAVDDSKAVRAARRLIDRVVPVDADALADPTTDLRRLLRG